MWCNLFNHKGRFNSFVDSNDTQTHTSIGFSLSFFIVRSGAIVIVGPSGPETYAAGHVGVSPAGIKRGIYAIEDSVFTTMHANPENETDLTKIWEKLVYDDLTKSIDLEKRKLLEKT